MSDNGSVMRTADGADTAPVGPSSARSGGPRRIAVLDGAGSVGTRALRLADRHSGGFEAVEPAPKGSSQAERADQAARFPDAVLAFTSRSRPIPGIIDVLSAILDEVGGMSVEPDSVRQMLDTEVWARAMADEIIVNTVGAAHSMGSTAMWAAQ